MFAALDWIRPSCKAVYEASPFSVEFLVSRGWLGWRRFNERVVRKLLAIGDQRCIDCEFQGWWFDVMK